MYVNNEHDGTSYAVSVDSIQQIIEYIEVNITEPLSPKSTAQYFHASVSSFSALFRMICGISLMEYIRNRRLYLAAQELIASNIRIIDLAYKYQYDTPESFAKAFARFHGFPPSHVRRTNPTLRVYVPLRIQVTRSGGWDIEPVAEADSQYPTNGYAIGQDSTQDNHYTDSTQFKGGVGMVSDSITTRLSVADSMYQEEWKTLLAVASALQEANVAFKVDGKTMIFAHGMDFKLDKIGLTFKWQEEQRVMDFFVFRGNADTSYLPGFKYFDAVYRGAKIRCMFYGNCPGDDTDEFLYRNTDVVEVDGLLLHVQTVAFYLENAESKYAEFYQQVQQWAGSR